MKKNGKLKIDFYKTKQTAKTTLLFVLYQLFAQTYTMSDEKHRLVRIGEHYGNFVLMNEEICSSVGKNFKL